MVRATPIIMLLLLLPVSGNRNEEKATVQSEKRENVGEVTEHREHVKEGLSDTGHCHGETDTPESEKTACTSDAHCRLCGADWVCYHMKKDTYDMKRRLYPETEWLPSYCHHL